MAAPDAPLASFIAGQWLPADDARLVTHANPGRVSATACRWCAATPEHARA